MKDDYEHFEISKQKDYLYVIKENISLVHPVYRNDPLNMYLILGFHTALLLDTGCGLYPLKPIIEELIEEKKLLVLNTHAHWDHVLGNEEFGEIYVHENEAYIVSQPYDLWFLKESPCEIVNIYKAKNFLIPPAENIIKIKDGFIFDLGDITVKSIHCPGHSPGSLCLLTNNNELFTSDVAYYGDTFLPNKNFFTKVLSTLSKLITICEQHKNVELYPSHRIYPCDKTLLTDLYNGIKNIENLWDTRKSFDFFEAWQIDDDKFRYYISKI
jgi:glyoxylase-like metal-dependent hydrolase (beta-lactamase superfamily II)